MLTKLFYMLSYTQILVFANLRVPNSASPQNKKNGKEGVMTDAQIGFWFMFGSAVVIGGMFGLQVERYCIPIHYDITKNRYKTSYELMWSRFEFAEHPFITFATCIAVVFYHVGSLAFKSASLTEHGLSVATYALVVTVAWLTTIAIAIVLFSILFEMLGHFCRWYEKDVRARWR